MKKLILPILILISVATFSQDKKQCAATTKAGTQCMHKTTSTYCKVHDPATPRCGAPTKTGKPCARTVKAIGDKCFNHKTN